MFIKKCENVIITQFIFSMETPWLFIPITSGLIAVENDSGMLLALAILKDSAPIAE